MKRILHSVTYFTGESIICGEPIQRSYQEKISNLALNIFNLLSHPISYEIVERNRAKFIGLANWFPHPHPATRL